MSDPLLSTASRNALDRAGLSAIVTGLDAALARPNRLRHGSLDRWADALATMPASDAVTIDLDRAAPKITFDDLDRHDSDALLEGLRALVPWRKGPFEVGNHLIDAEWRSDLKWNRLIPHLDDLRGRHLLDVGSGNGYFCLRAAGAGCASVVGIDPLPLYVMQFRALAKYVGTLPVSVLPLRAEDLNELPPAFDTVLSMGVLYHRRSPLDHLRELKDLLRPGGQLVLETLVVPGVSNTVLVPADRYARMRNVWFLPSVPATKLWLQRLGFAEIRAVSQTRTTVDEQRPTPWMEFESLANTLDPDHPRQTIEGYPGPTRAIFVAKKPA